MDALLVAGTGKERAVRAWRDQCLQAVHKHLKPCEGLMANCLPAKGSSEERGGKMASFQGDTDGHNSWLSVSIPTTPLAQRRTHLCSLSWSSQLERTGASIAWILDMHAMHPGLV
jgi:hypothetical protein